MIRLSVCMTTYNGAAFVREQVTSVLANLGEHDELIISDDGSTDDTLKIINEFADPRIFLHHGPQQGVVANVESALNAARGQYIFLADQDDIWHDRKVDTMLPHLASNILVVSDGVVVDEHGIRMKESMRVGSTAARGFVKNLWRNHYSGCVMAFHRTLLNGALPIPKSVAMHDWYLGLLADAIGQVKFIPDKLICYRRHGENVSATGEGSQSRFWQKLIWRLSMALSVAKALVRVFVKPKGSWRVKQRGQNRV